MPRRAARSQGKADNLSFDVDRHGGSMGIPGSRVLDDEVPLAAGAAAGEVPGRRAPAGAGQDLDGARAAGGQRARCTPAPTTSAPPGIFVEARQLVEVGTRVMCDIPLPGGTRRLAGEVARLQPLPFSSSAVGLGIRFVELDASARTLLEALVQREQEPAHLVHARFEGMAEAIRSQAVLTKDGVRLSAALPFLRPGSEVEISFVSGKSRVLSRGVVREAVVDNRRARRRAPPGGRRAAAEPHRRTGTPRRRGRHDRGADEDDVTAVDTPRALAAQQAARPSAPRPAVEPVLRTHRPGGPAAAAHARPPPAPDPGGGAAADRGWCRAPDEPALDGAGDQGRPGDHRARWRCSSSASPWPGSGWSRRRLPVATERAVRGPPSNPREAAVPADRRRARARARRSTRRHRPPSCRARCTCPGARARPAPAPSRPSPVRAPAEPVRAGAPAPAERPRRPERARPPRPPPARSTCPSCWPPPTPPRTRCAPRSRCPRTRPGRPCSTTATSWWRWSRSRARPRADPLPAGRAARHGRQPAQRPARCWRSGRHTVMNEGVRWVWIRRVREGRHPGALHPGLPHPRGAAASRCTTAPPPASGARPRRGAACRPTDDRASR